MVHESHTREKNKKILENKNQIPGSIYSDNGVVQQPAASLEMPVNYDGSYDSLPPSAYQAPKKPKRLLNFIKRADVILAVLLLMSMVGVLIVTSSKDKKTVNNTGVTSKYDTQDIPLEGLGVSTQGVNFGTSSVVINGATQLNGGLVVTPSLQPNAPKAGQLYFDQQTNVFAYYDGTQFVPLGGGVRSVGGVSGQVTLGGGLAAVGNQLLNAGVLSVGGQAGAIVLGNGLGMTGNTLQNSGVLNVLAGNNISVANDGNGNVTINNTGAGTGTVTSGGGTASHIPLFTSGQNIEDSIITQSGLTVTINGDLSVVTGGLSLSNALTVSNGGTGAASLAANGVIVGAGTGALTSVAAGGAGLCLLSTAGAPTWGACPGSSGVTTLNGLSGALNITNASAAGNTITIDNATTSTKGIASFNSTNFSVSGGAVNTIQNINSGATPTFAGVNTNNITPSAALTLGISAQTALLQGSTTTITSNGIGGDIILNSADTIELNGNTNLTGDLGISGNITVTGNNFTANGALNITPGGTLTVGASSRTLTLQGNASTTFSVDNGGNTTVIGFTTPTADTTLNFPALSAGTYTICTTSGNCSGTAVTLQSAYDNSASPEIMLDATRGALTLRDTVSGLGANLLEVQNNGGSTTYLAVTASGIAVTGTATVSGNINSTSGSLQTNNTTRVDNSGNLMNIGSLALSGAISGGTSFTGSGNINTTGGVIQTNSTTRIDNSGNLANIASITASGNAALQGGSLTLGTAVQAGTVVISDGSSNMGTIQVAALGQNTTYTLPDPGVLNVSICLSTGNCAGSGTGVTTAGGTPNTLAKFSGAQAIADSTITDDGTTVTTSGDLVIQGGEVTIGVANSQTGTLKLAHAGSAFIGSIVQGALTGSRTYTLPDSGGEICLNSGNCLGGGGGGGANAALSNLSSVAINTTLLPGSAGTVHLGSATLPFGDLFLAGASGTPGTNNFRITGASTGGSRTITLPDGSGTVCLQSSASCGFAPASGSTSYIQNQIASPQAADFYISGDGRAATLNAVTGINTGAIGGTQRIDASGNLVNIGNITAAGAITIASSGLGNNVIINGAGILDVQDAASFASTLNVTGTTTLSGDFAANGTNITLGNAASDLLTINATIQGGSPLVFEGGTSDANQLTLSIANLTADRTITLPDDTGTVCLTTGNCAGAGSGVTTTGGTIGVLAVFASGQAIADSLVSQAGGTVTVNGHLSLSSGKQFQINGTQISSAVLSDSANLAKLDASQTFTGNTVAFQNGSDSTNAFNIQKAGGMRVLTVDTSNGEVELGVGSLLDGKLVFNNVSNGNTVTILPGTPTTNRTITLPDSTGIVCLSSGNCAGAGATLQTAYNFSVGGTTPKIKLNNTLLGFDVQDADTTIGADLFNVRASNGAGLGQVLFGVGNTGDTTIQTTANSTSAFRLLTNGGTSVLVGDTQNGRILLGQSGTLDGTLVFKNSANSNTVTLSSVAVGTNRNITLPNADGTVCLTSGNCAGVGGTGDVLQGGNSFGSAMTIGTNDGFSLNLETNGVTALTLDGANGSALFKNSTNSAAALQVKNAAGTVAVFSVDTASTQLQVMGTGTNGAGSRIAFGSDNRLSIGGYGTSNNNGLQLKAYASVDVVDIDGNESFTINTQNGLAMVNAVQDAFGGLNVYKKNGHDVLKVSTAGTTGNIKIGYVGDSEATVLYLDADATSEPAGSNGGMYYNASLNKFRCYQNGGWVDCIPSGVGSIGTIDSQTKSANGAVISSGSLVLQTADASFPGLVSTGTQTFAGNKTFSGTLNSNTFSSSALTFGAASAATIQPATSQALNITGHAASTWKTDSGDLNIYAAGQLNIGNSGVGNTINIGTDNVAHDIYIGNAGGGIQSVTVGSTNSSSKLTLQGGSNGIQFNTTSNISLGFADATGTLLVLDTKNTSGDPTGVDGAMYYNSNAGRFRCYQNGGWADCISASGGFVSLQNAYTNSTGGSTSEIILDSTRSTLDIQDRSTSNGGSLGANLLNFRAAAATDSTAGSLLLSVGSAGDLLFGENANHTLSVTTRATNAVGRNLTVSAGAAGSGASAFAGGQLTLQAGDAAGTGNANGGTVLLAGGNKVGSSGTAGGVRVKNAADSGNAFEVQTAGGASLLNVNSTSSAITLLGNNTASISSWTNNTNSLPDRYDSSFATANGYVYVAGGYGSGDTAVNTVYYAKFNADGSIGSWATTTALPNPRAQATSVAANGYLYVIGGKTDVLTAQSTVYYAKLNANGTVGSWNTTTDLSVMLGRASHTSVVANGYVYIIGGEDSSGVSHDTVYYAKLNTDGTVGSWNTTNDLSGIGANQQRRWHTSVVANGYVYSLGGQINGTDSTQVAYAKINTNGTLGSWATTTGLPTTRNRGAAVVLNGYIYHLGGHNSTLWDVYSAPLNANGTIGSWTAQTHMNTERRGLGAVASNGYVYAIAGENGGSVTNQEYASPARVTIGGALDLVGLSGENLAEGGSGGQLTAGDTLIAGTLTVNNAASLKDVSILGGLSVMSSNDSTAAFSVLNSTNAELIGADSTNSIVRLLANNTGHLPTFSSTSNLNTPRESTGVAVVNGYAYLLGGYNAAGTKTNTVQYAKINTDGTLGTWSTTTGLPTPGGGAGYGGMAVTTYNGYIYAHGGGANATDSQAIYYAKPNLDGTVTSWSTATPTGVNTDYPSMVAYNGYLYEVAANDQDVHYAKINGDGSIDSFSVVSNWLSQPRRGAVTVAANGFLYVMGGINSSGTYYGKFRADGSVGTPSGAAGAASTSSAMTNNRKIAAGVVANGYVYVLGGNSGTAEVNTVYYAPLNGDGSIGTWVTDTTTLLGNRSGGSAFVANSYVYYLGGYDGAVANNNSWYTSTPRVKIGGSLDLVGYSGENMAEGGSGGRLTAGDTNVVGTLSVSGNAMFRDGLALLNTFSMTTSNNSTAAFVVMNASSVPQFVLDTTNSRVYVGNPTADSTGTLLVLDNKNTTGDPTGVAGGMYYNSVSKVFRCYQNGAWKNCIGLDGVDSWWIRPAGTAFTATGVGLLTSSGSLLSNNQASAPYVQATTGTTIGNAAGISTSFAMTRRSYNTACTVNVRSPASLPTGARVAIGLFTASPTNADDFGGSHIAFKYSTVVGDTGASTGWRASTRDGGVNSIGGSNVSGSSNITTNTDYVLRFRIDDANGRVYMSVNGGTEDVVTANLPAAATDLGFVMQIITSDTNADTWNFGRAYCEANN